jgi:hypothetical protein
MTSPTSSVLKSKVLIGVPTFHGHAWCREYLLEFLEKQKHDVCVVWNGEEEPWGFDEVVRIDDFDIEVNPVLGEEQSALQGALVKKQNYLRQKVLDEGYTHLFHLESDVIPPDNAIERLLSHGVEMCTGIYFVRIGQHRTVKMRGNEFYEKQLKKIGAPPADMLFYSRVNCMPSIWGYASTTIGGVDEPQKKHYVWTIEDWIRAKNSGRNPVPIAASGIGGMLISRKVLEKVHFTKGNDLTDYRFCNAADYEGFQLFADVDLIYQHFSTVTQEDAMVKKMFERSRHGSNNTA